jgi:ubiquinol-cytochrome c reductase cytochrome b subunit
MIAALVMVVLVVLIARAKGVVLDAPADPQSQYPARPEWYFSPLSQLLHHFQGPMQIVGTAVIPGLVTGYLAVLPFVDSDKRVGVARLAALAPLALFAAGAAFLGWELASHDRGDREFQKAQHAAQQERARALRLARRGISPDGPLDMMHNDPEVRPRALFAQHCGSCHAVRGVSTERKGPRLDGFGSRAWGAAFVAWPEHPELMGTSEIDDMQPMRRLSDDDLRAVGEWLHAQGVARGEPAADVALVERAVPIIRDRCNGCHLGSLAPADAEGAARDAPNLDGWGSREWIYEQIVNPHRLEQYGARNKMPRFRDKLSERELQMIVEYVRSLRTREAPTLIRPPRATPSAPAADGDAGTPTAP